MRKIKKKTNFKRKPRRKARFPMSEFFLSKSGKSKIQELRIRDDIGGTRAKVDQDWTSRTPKGSHYSKDTMRGDVEAATVLAEAKQTSKPHFFLSEKILKKIDKESFNLRKTPAVIIEFLAMPFGTESSWAIVPQTLVKEKLEEQNLLITNSLKYKTKKKRIKLKIPDLKNIDQEATAKGKIPVILCEFMWMNGGVANEWAILPYSVFLKMVKSEVSTTETEEPSEENPDEGPSEEA